MEKVMHETARRLFEAAKLVRPEIEGPADLARALNQSEQTINNWSYRGNGVSKDGRLTAQKELGISATWIEGGTGTMLVVPAHTLRDNDLSKKSHISGNFTASSPGTGRNVDLMTRPVGDSPNFRRVYVVGKAQGGLPERIWTDGDHLVGAIDEYAEIATPDPQAFICPVVGDSMYPRYMPGEYVLVEPNTPPQIGGTVLVRLATGETMLKRLEHRANGHVRLTSWNDPVQHTFREEDISWMYYVAHPVPPEKIKMRF